MFLQQIGNSFVDQILERFAALGRQRLKCLDACRRDMDHLAHGQLPAAVLTRSSDSGMSRKRWPSASATALASAADAGPWLASPVPRNGWRGRSITWTSMRPGRSVNLAIG